MSVETETNGCGNSQTVDACGDCVGCLRVGMRAALEGRAAALAEVDRLTRELRDARSRILSDEERTKLTGDALHAEAEADRLRAMVKSLGGDA